MTSVDFDRVIGMRMGEYQIKRYPLVQFWHLVMDDNREVTVCLDIHKRLLLQLKLGLIENDVSVLEREPLANDSMCDAALEAWEISVLHGRISTKGG